MSLLIRNKENEDPEEVLLCDEREVWLVKSGTTAARGR